MLVVLSKRRAVTCEDVQRGRYEGKNEEVEGNRYLYMHFKLDVGTTSHVGRLPNVLW